MSLQKRESDKTIYQEIFFIKAFSLLFNKNFIATEKLDGFQINFWISSDGENSTFFSHNAHPIEIEKGFNSMKEVVFNNFKYLVKNKILLLIKKKFKNFKSVTFHTEGVEKCSGQTLKPWNNGQHPIPQEKYGKLYVFEIKIEFEDNTQLNIRPYQDGYDDIFKYLNIPSCIIQDKFNENSCKSICDFLKKNYRTVEGVILFFPEISKGYKFRTGWTDSAPTTKDIIIKNSDLKLSENLSEHDKIKYYIVDMYNSTKKIKKPAKKINPNQDLIDWLKINITKVGDHNGINYHIYEGIKDHDDKIKTFKENFVKYLVEQFIKDNGGKDIGRFKDFVLNKRLKNIELFFKTHFPKELTPIEKLDKIQKEQEKLKREILNLTRKLSKINKVIKN